MRHLCITSRNNTGNMLSEHQGSLARHGRKDYYCRTLQNLCEYTDSIERQLRGFDTKEKIRRLNILIDKSNVDHDKVSLKGLHMCEQILFPSIALLNSLSLDDDILETDTKNEVVCRENVLNVIYKSYDFSRSMNVVSYII